MILPSVVFPIHDPDGLIFHHVNVISPFLKQYFSSAFLGVTAITHDKYKPLLESLAQDDFYQLLITPQDAQIGRQFKLLYQQAALSSQPDHILHLCFPDRLAFALQDQYRDQFLEDIKSVVPERAPIIFQRSQKAWNTHPRNYFETERFVMTMSKRLLGKAIDFAWCHLAIQAAQLEEILPRVQRRDLSMVAEMIVPLIDNVSSQDVDWLAWEDPFIYSRNADKLKNEREKSVSETLKRLAYVIPMVQLIAEIANDK